MGTKRQAMASYTTGDKVEKKKHDNALLSN